MLWFASMDANLPLGGRGRRIARPGRAVVTEAAADVQGLSRDRVGVRTGEIGDHLRDMETARSPNRFQESERLPETASDLLTRGTAQRIEVLNLRRHGRGHWFESSIAHHSFCRSEGFLMCE